MCGGVALLVGAIVLLAGIAAARTARRVGLPSLLLFLAVGVVVGEDVLDPGTRQPSRARCCLAVSLTQHRRTVTLGAWLVFSTP
jgi:cell volume regulation protein A